MLATVVASIKPGNLPGGVGLVRTDVADAGVVEPVAELAP